MTEAARKLIAAVQHSLMGALLVRLWPALWIISLLGDRPGRPTNPLLLVMLPAAALLLFLAWFVGFLAVHRRPAGRAMPERLYDAPSNSFEAWAEIPRGGLKPPRLIRSLVMSLGRKDSKPVVWVWGTVSMSCGGVLSVLIVMSYFDNAALASISPALATASAQTTQVLCLAVLTAAVVVRRWAVDYRDQLSSGANAEPPRASP